jgi:hypothetical protein
MDLAKTIEELRREKQKLDRVIASLEELQAAVTVAPLRKERRGRKSMGAEERREVSERMKKYWAARLAKRSHHH